MKIGLVFAGGGGRGAYHIGVWKALQKSGLDKEISCVAGTSVGGLNAALFLQGDFEKAVNIWSNITVEKILSPLLGHKKKLNVLLTELNEGGLYNFARTGLLNIIEKDLDINVFDNSSMDCFITCTRTKKIKKDRTEFKILKDEVKFEESISSYNDGEAVYFNMKEFSADDRRRILLATSAIPFVFPSEKIGDYYYIDGGFKDNIPVQPLVYKSNCDIVIVVHLERDVSYRELAMKKYHNTRVWEIRPRNYQGGIITGTLNFSSSDAYRRIEEGYNENIETLKQIRSDIDMMKESDRIWGDTIKMDRDYTTAINDEIRKLSN